MVGSLHVWYNAPRFGITESQISRFFYSFRTQRYFTLSDAWWRQSNFLNGLLVIMPPWPQCTARWATVQPFGVKYSEDAVCQQLSQSIEFWQELFQEQKRYTFLGIYSVYRPTTIITTTNCKLVLRKIQAITMCRKITAECITKTNQYSVQTIGVSEIERVFFRDAVYRWRRQRWTAGEWVSVCRTPLSTHHRPVRSVAATALRRTPPGGVDMHCRRRVDNYRACDKHWLPTVKLYMRCSARRQRIGQKIHVAMFTAT